MVPVTPEDVLKARPCTAASLNTPLALPTAAEGVAAGAALLPSSPPPQPLNSSPKTGPMAHGVTRCIPETFFFMTLSPKKDLNKAPPGG